MGVPSHIGFIMDGNRRWAKSQGKIPTEGHKAGAGIAENVIEWCVESGIKHVTLWALSTENLVKRSSLELSVIFGLLEEISSRHEKMKKYGVQLSFIGNRENLPEKYRESIARMEAGLKVENPTYHVHIAINYGGREELVQAVNELIVEGVSEVQEQDITSHLYTKHIPDVELIVRTGGSTRLSGFMPWQSVYAELFFTSTYWPDFSREEFNHILKYFEDTQRNFGA